LGLQTSEKPERSERNLHLIEYSVTFSVDSTEPQELLVFIHHPEPQLEGCHSKPQLKNATCLTPIPSHKLRNINKLTFKVSDGCVFLPSINV